MNGPFKLSQMDLKGTKRLNAAWKSRVHIFMQSPLQWKKISWQKTNETTLLGKSLETLLSKKSGQKAFREFLKSEFCEENLDFLLACQNFQTLQRPEERKKKAAKIYEEFIRDDSPKQVNLDFNTTKVICQSLQQPGPSCFVVAQKKIFSLMENDSFSRFLQSEHYKVLTGAASKPRGLRKHRAAMRIKSAGDELEVNRLQDGLVLWHEH
uniref:RGS domain-containing protein n=1 Tax=Oryzias latipes TaxID=8090 RepID=A0A3P9IW64_ORYLA